MLRDPAKNADPGRRLVIDGFHPISWSNVER